MDEGADNRRQLTAEQFKLLLAVMAEQKTDKQLCARIAELEKKSGHQAKAVRHELAALNAEAARRGILKVSRRERLRQGRRDAFAREARRAETQRITYQKEVSGRDRGEVADIGVTEASAILRGETYASQKQSTWRIKKRPLG